MNKLKAIKFVTIVSLLMSTVQNKNLALNRPVTTSEATYVYEDGYDQVEYSAEYATDGALKTVDNAGEVTIVGQETACEDGTTRWLNVHLEH